jgi:hypothetical protein
MKNATRPITAPVNNNTTHRISNIDFTPTIEDVEINIQYSKNKNINVLKKSIVYNFLYSVCMFYIYLNLYNKYLNLYNILILYKIIKYIHVNII